MMMIIFIVIYVFSQKKYEIKILVNIRAFFRASYGVNQNSNKDNAHVSREKIQQEMENCSEQPEIADFIKADVVVKKLEEESKIEDDSLNTNKELEQFFLEMGKKDSTLKSYEAEIEKLKSLIMELEKKNQDKDVEVIPPKA